jgi:antitoxin component YwqK of YwqJK toxin-antitoxin module
MHGKTNYANGQPVFRQNGDTLTYFFKSGLKKAEGTSVNGVMKEKWCFCRESEELWQVGHFLNGVKNGPWVRYARDGKVEKVEIFRNGTALKGQAH